MVVAGQDSEDGSWFSRIHQGMVRKRLLFRENVRAFWGIALHESLRCLRIWKQTMLIPACHSLLSLFVFGQVDRFFSGGSGVISGRVWVSGLLLSGVMSGTSASVAHAIFTGHQYGTLDALLASPAHPSSIILGYLAGGLFRSLGSGLLFLLGANFLFFGCIPFSPFEALAIYLLLASLCGFIGFMQGSLARSYDDLGFLSFFMATPVLLSGGLSPSPALLGEVNRFQWINPLRYLVQAFQTCWFRLPSVRGFEGRLLLWLFLLNLLAYWMAHRLLLRRREQR